MTCEVCKARLRANAIFCDTCGQKIDKSDAVMTVTLPKNIGKLPHKQTNKQPSAALLLSGGALVVVGVWLGATFLSAEPAPVPRETANLSQQVPVIVQTPMSTPSVIEIKPEPPVKFEPEAKTTPKTSTRPNPTNTSDDLADPFNSSGKNPEVDLSLNPFSKKKAPVTIVKEEQLAEDPFKSKPISKNPDATLKPRFNTTP